MSRGALRVAIVGGGIGGLTTALALRHHGLEAHVYEQSTTFSEVGAGLALGLNAVRILDRLGLEEALDSIAVLGRGREVRHWYDGDVIVETRGQATPPNLRPHLVHRGEFLRVLLDALDERQLHTGKRCVRVQQSGVEIRLDFEDGSIEVADLVVGADGIHSMVRAIHYDDRPRFSAMIAYRGLIPMERLDFLGHRREITTLWLGPRKHVVIYPVSAGRLMNFVAFVSADGEDAPESWSAEGDLDRLVDHFRGAEDALLGVIGSLDSTMRWALYEREPLVTWSFSRTTLLGDAAHAMQPHLGQGAGQSIEDAAVLARCLADPRPPTLERRLLLYEEVRKPRTRRVQEASRRAGEISEMADDAQQRRLAPDALKGRDDWIASYDTDQAFEKGRAALVPDGGGRARPYDGREAWSRRWRRRSGAGEFAGKGGVM